MAIVTSHAGAASVGKALLSWGDLPVFVEDGKHGMISACQAGFVVAGLCEGYDILAYLHDDVIIHDTMRWYVRVREEFSDPKVGIVGFGGSRTWGVREIYRTPYQIMQLSRGLYLSNMTDAESHGARYDGPPIDVAVLDGFCLIMRREFMEKAGGWPVGKIEFHGYDFFWCGMAHELGYKIRLVPVSCTHIGGQTSVSQKMDDGLNHAKGHEYIYKRFQGILPVSV